MCTITGAQRYFIKFNQHHNPPNPTLIPLSPQNTPSSAFFPWNRSYNTRQPFKKNCKTQETSSFHSDPLPSRPLAPDIAPQSAPSGGGHNHAARASMRRAVRGVA